MRYDPNKPQTTEFDPALGVWSYAEPIPYHAQQRPRWHTRLALVVAFRSFKCRRRFCTWQATESGGYCDRHDPPSSDESAR